MATEPRRAGQEANASYCNWHPDTETRLFCSQCGKSICTLCMVQVPVGIRCRECGRPERLPTYDVQPSYLLRAVGAGAAVAIVGGVLWLGLNAIFGGVPLVSSIFGLAVAYAIGEIISRAVNRKRGVTLAWIAGGSMVGAYLVSGGFLHLFSTNFISVLFSLLFLGVAVYTAASRLR